MTCVHGSDGPCDLCAVSGSNSFAIGEGSESLAQIRKENAEIIRVDRWHATYNAALTGLHGFSSELHQNGFDVAASHEMALQAANLAHGPLKP